MLTVFLVHDAEQAVRSYSAPSMLKYVPLPPPTKRMRVAPQIQLTSVRMPIDDEPFWDDPVLTDVKVKNPASPTRLCQWIPALEELLGPLTTDVAGVLTQLLAPEVAGCELEDPQIAYSGGEPMIIQTPHEPQCPACGAEMRFLFQFGEIIPQTQLAVAGVGYVYGCDKHPHLCRGFVDSH